MWLYHRVMSPNDADGMANSVDPDLGLHCLSENLGSLRFSFKHFFILAIVRKKCHTFVFSKIMQQYANFIQ